jgi:hypothetical protein
MREILVFAHHLQVRQRKNHQSLVGVLGQTPVTWLESGGGKAHLFHGSTVSDQTVTGLTFVDLP